MTSTWYSKADVSRRLALRRSESRNCGLYVVYLRKDGATLMVSAWQSEKQENKLGLRVPF